MNFSELAIPNGHERSVFLEKAATDVELFQGNPGTSNRSFKYDQSELLREVDPFVRDQ